jgi:hypothetical protein
MLERLASFLPERQYERFIARRYKRQMDRAHNAFLKSDRWQQIKACKHESRTLSTTATAIKPPSIAEKCDDCGIGIVTVVRNA